MDQPRLQPSSPSTGGTLPCCAARACSRDCRACRPAAGASTHRDAAHGWRAVASLSRGEPDALQGLFGPLLTTVLLAPLLMPALAGLPGLRPFTGERR